MIWSADKISAGFRVMTGVSQAFPGFGNAAQIPGIVINDCKHEDIPPFRFLSQSALLAQFG